MIGGSFFEIKSGRSHNDSETEGPLVPNYGADGVNRFEAGALMTEWPAYGLKPLKS